ncbi:MAG: 30S ribosomal protein S17 [Candidatus Melainabacteria bacterium RIFCSPHIGHO2_02_FULL_34_12]|nr:MAG: 30S ribosomal protein S17 [Candidatus Melainabacteria bacterium RIFCSPHIGHO2_02_FULL_34_12]
MPKKILRGNVVSNKMEKTIVVAVENRAPHPKYQKTVVRTKNFKAHDEKNECKIGDKVAIEEHRPISKTKKWILKEIVRRAD